MASDAYYVENGVIYEIRVNIRDLDECVVVKSSDSNVVTVGTILGRSKWCVILDEARFRAIRQKDFELSSLKRQLEDLEHSAPHEKIAKSTLDEIRGRFNDLRSKVEHMKYKNPQVVQIKTTG